MKNDTLLMHRLHGAAIGSYQSQGTNARYIFILRRARSANSRNFARIACTTGAMALSSYGIDIARRRSIIRANRVYSGRRIEEKASFHGLATKPETNDRLICYHRTCYSEHVHRDGTIANNNTCNPAMA